MMSLDVNVSSLATNEPSDHSLDVVVLDNDGSAHDLVEPFSLTWLKLPNE